MSSEDPSTWRLVTRGGVRYKRVEMNCSFDWSSGSVQETILIQSSDLQNFLRESFNFVTTESGIPVWVARGMPGKLVGFITRNISVRSHTPGLPIDPFSADLNAPSKTYAPILSLDITYSNEDEEGGPVSDSRDDADDPTVFLDISANATGEWFHVPTPDNVWADARDVRIDGELGSVLSPDTPHTVLYPQTQWNLTWPRVDRNFFITTMIPRLRKALGKVNENSFDLLADAAPETLMLAGYNIVEERQFYFDDDLASRPSLQAKPIRLDVIIIEKRTEEEGVVVFNPNPLAPEETYTAIRGWQHIFNEKTGTWRKIWRRNPNVADPDDELAWLPIYQTYDFDLLFAAQ